MKIFFNINSLTSGYFSPPTPIIKTWYLVCSTNFFTLGQTKSPLNLILSQQNYLYQIIFIQYFVIVNITTLLSEATKSTLCWCEVFTCSNFSFHFSSQWVPCQLLQNTELVLREGGDCKMIFWVKTPQYWCICLGNYLQTKCEQRGRLYIRDQR